MTNSRIGEVPDPKRVPAPEAAQPVNIRPGSAMAIVGLFVEIIRRRFTPESDLPWAWHDQVQSGGDQGIAIESAFNEDQSQRNYRAAVYVDRDELIIGRTVIGDSAGHHLPSGLKAFWALESVPLLIECVAAKKAESAIIADLLHVYLHASSDLIQAKFGLHDMTPLTMGRTQPFPRDKTQWVTPISFTVQFNLRWTNAPTAPLLRQIELAIAASTLGSANAYFEEVAVHGRSK